jgi:hypothetical protein
MIRIGAGGDVEVWKDDEARDGRVIVIGPSGDVRELGRSATDGVVADALKALLPMRGRGE